MHRFEKARVRMLCVKVRNCEQRRGRRPPHRKGHSTKSSLRRQSSSFRKLGKLSMASPEGGNEEEEWERLFNEETPEHIQCSIVALVNEIYGEFRMNLEREVVMSNYWRINFILFCSMNDRDSYAEMIHITMDTFKENDERNLAYMCSLLRLYEPPFQHGQ